MFLKCLHAEKIKLKRSPIWIPLFVIPLLSAVIGTFNYLQSKAILTQEWYSLWTQHTLFLCYFFFPVLLGVLASYLFRLEHLNHNWNAMLSVPIKGVHLFLSKLSFLSFMAVLTQLWVGVLFVLAGLLCGFSSPIPLELVSWLSYGIIGGIVVCAIQLVLSLLIKSFAVPIGLALVGGIAGFAAFAKGLGVWFPYSLYSLGMRANSPGGALQADPLVFIIISVLYVVFCVIFCAFLMRQKKFFI